ncbi:MAG: ABC transporter permease [Verrucomicrobia bacterium]|nr:ABC transporter permease [Verrucomicrobiota bacterium]
MNWNNIATVYLKELKDSLRDRRTLISTIVIPTLVMPLMFFGMGKVMTSVVTKAREDIPTVAVLGGEDSPGVVRQFRESKRMRVVPTPADWKQAISDKRLRVAVQLPEKFEAQLQAGAAPAVKVFYYEGELKSENGARVLERFLGELREQVVAERLAAHGLPKTAARPFEFRRENVAPPEKVGGNLFGGLVPYLIIILCFTGAMYPAMDLTAGEKERGTMETLLCSPVPRVDIVLGKFLMVLTGSLSAMAFMLLSMGVTVAVGGSLMMGGGMGRAAAAGAAAKSAAAPAASGGGVIPMIDPLGVVGVIAMVLPVAVLFAAAAFTISLFAKSYKEAQSYLGPMIILVIMPGVIGMLPGIDLSAKTALIPILNLSLVCKEMLSGVWHWGYIGLIFGSSSLYAAIALWLAVRMFNREDVLFRA